MLWEICGRTQIGIAVPGCSQRIASAAVSQEKAEKSVLLSPGLFKGLPVLFLGPSSSSLERVRSLKALAQSKCVDPCGAALCATGSLEGYRAGVGTKLSCWGWTVQVQCDMQAARGCT